MRRTPDPVELPWSGFVCWLAISWIRAETPLRAGARGDQQPEAAAQHNRQLPRVPVTAGKRGDGQKCRGSQPLPGLSTWPLPPVPAPLGESDAGGGPMLGGLGTVPPAVPPPRSVGPAAHAR